MSDILMIGGFCLVFLACGIGLGEVTGRDTVAKECRIAGVFIVDNTAYTCAKKGEEK